ncbi:hypothetical protein Tco_1033374 [Tanacetum coccineum]
MISPTVTSQIPRKSKGLSELSKSPERTTDATSLQAGIPQSLYRGNSQTTKVLNGGKTKDSGFANEISSLNSALDVLSRSGLTLIST